ncbi:MAG: Rsd/AlgQ family anti-sigma factor [Candidatus Dasytiphilus stammeri]
MLNQLQNNETLNNYLLNTLLKPRKELLIAYYKIIGFKPHQEIFQAIDETALILFCSHLLDYLSYGHFYLYRRLLENLKSPLSKSKKFFIAKIFFALQKNTQLIMKLYDIYLCVTINDDNYLHFQKALSEVGEALASRFILEDKLINLT